MSWRARCDVEQTRWRRRRSSNRWSRNKRIRSATYKVSIRASWRELRSPAANTRCTQTKLVTIKPLCAQTPPQRRCLSALVTRESLGQWTLFWFTHCCDSHHINILSGKNFIWTINKCDKWVFYMRCVFVFRPHCSRTFPPV